MSQLIAIRHGQAMLFADDYDQLSDLGREQSRQLGEFWCGRKLLFDEIYTGPRRRQVDTARIVTECYEQAGLPYPEPVVLDDLDEFNADGLVHQLLPRLRENHAHLRDLADSYEMADANPDRSKHFQRLLEGIMALWHQGAATSPDVETWESFHQRVQRALTHIMSRKGRGRRVAIFTSGGPISVAVQHTTKAPEETALDLVWRIRNCSLTEIVFTTDRSTLDTFNTIPHLNDPALWTFW